MTWLRAAWAWLRRWWGVVAAAAGVLVGGLLAWGAYRRGVASAQDAVEVERTLRAIAELRGRREELKAQDKVDELEVARIDDQLEANRQRIEEARRRADVPDDELAEEFKRLGY